MANGVVAIYDIAKSEEAMLLFRSEIGEYFHIDRVTSLEWTKFQVNNSIKLVRLTDQLLTSASLDGKLLFWDVADKLKFPKRGFILSNKKESSKGVHLSSSLRSPVNDIKQKGSMRNGFVCGGSSGLVLRVEVLPVFNDNINKSVLSNPGWLR